MAAIIEPLATGIILFCLGVVGLRLFQYAGFEADEMETKMVFRLLLGPLCLAVLVLVTDGVANYLRLFSWLKL
ncbi:MAG TPA: hypothetical protein VHZ32_16765 [Rhizomicrobium sp.]|jgi:hypothetical protein|nr:hypothetical protein [Rhizomicrobium sp.]